MLSLTKGAGLLARYLGFSLIYYCKQRTFVFTSEGVKLLKWAL